MIKDPRTVGCSSGGGGVGGNAQIRCQLLVGSPVASVASPVTGARCPPPSDRNHLLPAQEETRSQVLFVLTKSLPAGAGENVASY